MAPGAVGVAGDPAGITGYGAQTGDAGEPVRRFKDGEVSAGSAEELRGENRSKPGQTQQGPGVPVLGDLPADQRIKIVGCRGGDGQWTLFK